MTTVDWIVVGVFLTAMLIISIVSAKRLRASEEFFTSGRRVRRFTLILFAFGSGTSSDSQSSVMAGTWQSGLSGLWWQFLWLPITPFYWIVAPLLRRLRAITTADFFAMRFGPSTAALYSIYGMVISVVLMAGVLFGSAKLLDILTNPLFSNLSAKMDIQIPLIDVRAALQAPSVERPPIVTWRQLGSENLAACCLAAMMAVCATCGGLRAVILIDSIQGLLRVILTFVLLPVIFMKIGGFGVMHTMESIKPGMLDFVASSNAAVVADHEPFTPMYLCMLSIAALAGIIVQPHIMTICGAGQTELDARIGFTFGNLLKRFMAIAWTLIALACIVWYLGPSSPLQSPTADEGQQQLLSQLRVLASGDKTKLTSEELNSALIRDSAFADRIFGRVTRDIFQEMSPGLMGLAVAMLLAAAISHCGTQMIVGSGLFAEHFYRHHISPGRIPRHYLAIGRLCGPALIVTALLLQTTFSNITDALRLVIKTPAVIGISMWMGFVWIRWNAVAVWATTVSAALIGMLCGFFPEEVRKTLPGFSQFMFVNGPDGLAMIDAWKIAFILFGGLFSGVVATLLTHPERDDQLEHFYRVIRTPVAADEHAYASAYVPPKDTKLAPAVSFAGFQFPGATKAGIIGFVAAWIVVIGMVLAAKWLSLRL